MNAPVEIRDLKAGDTVWEKTHEIKVTSDARRVNPMEGLAGGWEASAVCGSRTFTLFASDKAGGYAPKLHRTCQYLRNEKKRI